MQAQVPVLARLRGASKRFGPRIALDGIDLDIPGGQALALLGANGAGKTTAVSLLLGLLRPECGLVEVFGRPPGDLAAKRGVGVMLQSAGVPEHAKVGELLALTRSYYPNPRPTTECVALAGLEGLLDRRYGQLSGGQQRRVQFALALCGRPRLLFLDEPSTGLDVGARTALWRAVRHLVTEGVGVLLTTHYLEEAESLADQVVVLGRGKIIASGSIAEVRARVAQRQVRCSSVLEPATIAAWPEVREVRRQEGRVEIVTDAAEDLVRRLLTADATLSELEVRRASLAEAFVEITRDDAVSGGTAVNESPNGSEREAA